MTKTDFSKITNSILGGEISNVQKPLIRKFWSCGLRRRVTVTFIRILIVHIWVTVVEEDNPLLDKENGRVIWRHCWDDQEGRGLRFSKALRTLPAARSYTAKIIRENFADETKWKIEEENFLREGD